MMNEPMFKHIRAESKEVLVRDYRSDWIAEHESWMEAVRSPSLMDALFEAARKPCPGVK